MARWAGFRRLLCGIVAVAGTLGGPASAAKRLQLVNDDFLGSFEGIADDKAPGFGVEVVRQVFAGMGQDASFEFFPARRAWMMVVRGERDGMLATLRTEGQRFCSFPDEPLMRDRWVLFVRTADIGKLKFSSLDDLIGHTVAVRRPIPGVSEQPTMSPELWNFLREHKNMIPTNDTDSSLRMLAASRVDYAVTSLVYGMSEITKLRLSGKIEPILSRGVAEQNVYVCFTKARVSRALIDAFSIALKQFKQTEKFHAIYRKYFPNGAPSDFPQ
ncbi:transporter substrate-binding domain-containing protein [Mesorhizobium sp. LNHC221B00]|uniref:substrate-binding periplasmic protein n=1 Tax=Mesorhizobium sp. LNHC221B00 TaxID=1287233 RepID=UPI0009FC0F6C|nr:transporter substrate-binding domain-containing protein [Mesorhizobium sp. LNHC221B00]